ncbi:MAG: hypothetical protein AAB383_04940 [Patescibacteria group bacterium]
MQPRQPAYSLIFAFLIMTVIMIIATTTIENTNEKLAYFTEMEGSTEAALAAQSAAEQAVLAMKDYEAGYSLGLDEQVFQVDENGDGDFETWGDYTVYSTAQQNSTDGATGYYYTPIPGTGSAADDDDCTVRDSNHDGDFDDDEGVDHPCNWNKLMYGQSVTIPLYVSDGSETGVLTPADLGLSALYLKVRTPCADNVGQPDEADCSSRFELDTGDGSLEEDNSAILWQIIVEKTDGTSVSVIPDDTSAYDLYSRSYKRNSSLNTEIYEDLINSATGNIVLEISSFTNPETYAICSNTDVETLSLQLDIVTPLIDSSARSIPYLEWQLSTSSTSPFADTKAVISGEGYHQGKTGIYYYPFVITRSTTGESTSIYTLSN